MNISPPYMQMGQQENAARELQGSGQMGYVPNFVQDYLTAKGEAQKQRANKDTLDSYAAESAVDNAYSSGDSKAIAEVKAKYPAKTAQYEADQQQLKDKQTAAKLDISNKKMTAFQKLLELTPDNQTYNARKSQFASFTDDGQVPTFKDDATFDAYRKSATTKIGESKAYAAGALGYYQASQDPTADPATRKAAGILWNQEQEKFKASIDNLHATLDNKEDKGSKEAAPDENDNNSAQALMASSKILSGLDADVPENKDKGTPYQIKSQGIARNWIATNISDLQRANPKMSRNDAANASTQEAELHVTTDKDGNKTFDPSAQVVRLKGKLWRVSGQDPKNGFKLQAADGSQTWYKPQGQ